MLPSSNSNNNDASASPPIYSSTSMAPNIPPNSVWSRRPNLALSSTPDRTSSSSSSSTTTVTTTQIDSSNRLGQKSSLPSQAVPSSSSSSTQNNNNQSLYSNRLHSATAAPPSSNMPSSLSQQQSPYASQRSQVMNETVNNQHQSFHEQRQHDHFGPRFSHAPPPPPIPSTPFDDVIYSEGWGKGQKVEQNSGWDVRDSPPPYEDPSLWRPKPNTGTAVWEKTTGHKTAEWPAQAPSALNWDSSHGATPPQSSAVLAPQQISSQSPTNNAHQSRNVPNHVSNALHQSSSIIPNVDQSLKTAHQNTPNSNAQQQQQQRSSAWYSASRSPPPISASSGASAPANAWATPLRIASGGSAGLSDSPLNAWSTSSSSSQAMQQRPTQSHSIMQQHSMKSVDSDWSEWQAPVSAGSDSMKLSSSLHRESALPQVDDGTSVWSNTVGSSSRTVASNQALNSSNQLTDNSDSTVTSNNGPGSTKSWSQMGMEKEKHFGAWPQHNTPSSSLPASNDSWLDSQMLSASPNETNAPSNISTTKQYRMLTEMGFQSADVEKALRVCAMNYDAALEELTRGGDHKNASNRTSPNEKSNAKPNTVSSPTSPSSRQFNAKQQQANQQVQAIAAELSMAVRQGVISPSLLTQPISPETPVAIHQLIQQQRSLQNLLAQHELLQKQGASSGAPSAIQLQQMISKTQQNIQSLKERINACQARYLKQQNHENIDTIRGQHLSSGLNTTSAIGLNAVDVLSTNLANSKLSSRSEPMHNQTRNKVDNGVPNSNSNSWNDSAMSGFNSSGFAQAGSSNFSPHNWLGEVNGHDTTSNGMSSNNGGSSTSNSDWSNGSTFASNSIGVWGGNGDGFVGTFDAFAGNMGSSDSFMKDSRGIRAIKERSMNMGGAVGQNSSQNGAPGSKYHGYQTAQMVSGDTMQNWWGAGY